jgi:hypothetical protein
MLEKHGHFANCFAAHFILERFIARVGMEMVHEFLLLDEKTTEEVARTILDSARGFPADINTVKMVLLFATVHLA